MFDDGGLAEVIRKAMDRMAPAGGSAAEGAKAGSRALSVLRAIRPDLSLRQAEALLGGATADGSGDRDRLGTIPVK